MKFFLLGLLVGVAGLAVQPLTAEENILTSSSPKKNVIATWRVTVKPGHETDFRHELGEHARAFQNGDFSWRIGRVLSGSEGDTFQIVEGPFSWTEFGARGEQAATSRQNFERKVWPHLEKKSSTTFEILEEGMSQPGRTLWADHVAVVRYWVKPGKGMAAAEILKAYRQANVKRGFDFVTWHSINSGESVYDLFYQFPTGWKELDLDRIGIKEAFDELAGKGDYERQQARIADTFQRITNEMIEYFPIVNSK